MRGPCIDMRAWLTYMAVIPRAGIHAPVGASAALIMLLLLVKMRASAAQTAAWCICCAGRAGAGGSSPRGRRRALRMRRSPCRSERTQAAAPSTYVLFHALAACIEMCPDQETLFGPLQMVAWQGASVLTKRAVGTTEAFEEHVGSSAASVSVRPATPLRAGGSSPLR